ncbi:MAG: hypothetical protein IT428_06580 [Planctomycetaceae bacterium]|nr:hypothetical protein [Planctomycetaceae bacterium]
MTNSTENETVRCGVFETIETAENAVRGLLEAGFRANQISVVCSDEEKEAHFRRFEHEEPAGEHTPETAALGGAIGATLGGVLSAGVATAAGLSLLVAGPSLLLAGGVVGGLFGAMMTRAREKGLADFYDQSLTDGKILVGVEVRDPHDIAALSRAEQAFREAGVEPLSIDPQK